MREKERRRDFAHNELISLSLSHKQPNQADYDDDGDGLKPSHIHLLLIALLRELVCLCVLV